MSRPWRISVRRDKTSIFMFVHGEETLRSFHSRVGSALDLKDLNGLGLAVKNELIAPPLEYALIGWNSTLIDAGIGDNSEIFYVLRRDDGGFEEPFFTPPVHPPPS